MHKNALVFHELVIRKACIIFKTAVALGITARALIYFTHEARAGHAVHVERGAGGRVPAEDGALYLRGGGE